MIYKKKQMIKVTLQMRCNRRPVVPIINNAEKFHERHQKMITPDVAMLRELPREIPIEIFTYRAIATVQGKEYEGTKYLHEAHAIKERDTRIKQLERKDITWRIETMRGIYLTGVQHD